jgi:hypothetical protein
VNPGIGKTTGTGNRLSFLFYLILIYPGNHGNISIQVNHHPGVAEVFILINTAADVSQPLSSVHKASIIVCVIEYLRKQHTHCPRIMLDFGLVPRVLEGQNPRGFIAQPHFHAGQRVADTSPPARYSRQSCFALDPPYVTLESRRMISPLGCSACFRLFHANRKPGRLSTDAAITMRRWHC